MPRMSLAEVAALARLGERLLERRRAAGRTGRAGRCSRRRPARRSRRGACPRAAGAGCGSSRKRSLKLPGSISSALQTTYLGCGASGAERHGAPLAAGGVAGAAAAAQAGVGDGLRDVARGSSSRSARREALVAAGRDVVVERWPARPSARMRPASAAAPSRVGRRAPALTRTPPGCAATSAGATGPCRSASTIIAGPRSQAPRQTMGSSVKRSSGVVSPMPTPSCASMAARSSA